jgi:peptidoglycan/LPS O-acetylase OafA/YrhL
MQKINNSQSTFINLIRGVSAQLVLIGHLYGFYFSGQSIFIQNFGVVIFFILSGHLVTLSALRVIQNDVFNFKKFFIDRFSRIYAGLIPAIFLCVIIDVCNVIFISPNESLLGLENLNLKAFFVSIVNIGGLPNPIRIGEIIEPFGSMRPLWSVALEWWIYIFIGFIFLIFKNKKFVGISLITAGIIVSLLQSIFDLDHIRYFIVNAWFIASGIVLLKAKIFKNKLFLFVPLTYLIFIIFNKNIIYFYEPSVVISLILIYFSSFESVKNFLIGDKIKILINTLSSYSYSLYLIHYSIIVLAKPLIKIDGMIECLLIFFLCNLFAYIFYICFESRYIYLRNYLSTKFVK